MQKNHPEFLLREVSNVVKFIGAESRLVVARNWEEGERESCGSMDIELPICKTKSSRDEFHNNVNTLTITEL